MFFRMLFQIYIVNSDWMYRLQAYFQHKHQAEFVNIAQEINSDTNWPPIISDKESNFTEIMRQESLFTGSNSKPEIVDQVYPKSPDGLVKEDSISLCSDFGKEFVNLEVDV